MEDITVLETIKAVLADIKNNPNYSDLVSYKLKLIRIFKPSAHTKKFDVAISDIISAEELQDFFAAQGVDMETFSAKDIEINVLSIYAIVRALDMLAEHFHNRTFMVKDGLEYSCFGGAFAPERLAAKYDTAHFIINFNKKGLPRDYSDTLGRSINFKFSLTNPATITASYGLNKVLDRQIDIETFGGQILNMSGFEEIAPTQINFLNIKKIIENCFAEEV